MRCALDGGKHASMSLEAAGRRQLAEALEAPSPSRYLLPLPLSQLEKRSLALGKDNTPSQGLLAKGDFLHVWIACTVQFMELYFGLCICCGPRF